MSSADFWRRIAELEATVATLKERVGALEAKRPPGRPRKVEEAA